MGKQYTVSCWRGCKSLPRQLQYSVSQHLHPQRPSEQRGTQNCTLRYTQFPHFSLPWRQKFHRLGCLFTAVAVNRTDHFASSCSASVPLTRSVPLTWLENNAPRGIGLATRTNRETFQSVQSSQLGHLEILTLTTTMDV